MKASFDPYAENYEATISAGYALTGECRDYFAKTRISWLAAQLKRHSSRIGNVLDYGCGDGASVSLLLDLLQPDEISGVDVSFASIEKARKDYTASNIRFFTPEQWNPNGSIDLIYSNGVFHHINPFERPRVMQSLFQAVRPGGYLALWENNPWNPGTKLVMSRIPFDRDAITLSPYETKRLVTAAGFEVKSVHFHFIFPRALKWLRPLERWVSRLPFGAQYQVLAQKPTL